MMALVYGCALGGCIKDAYIGPTETLRIGLCRRLNGKPSHWVCHGNNCSTMPIFSPFKIHQKYSQKQPKNPLKSLTF
jgi:hypothetical protein